MPGLSASLRRLLNSLSPSFSSAGSCSLCSLRLATSAVLRKSFSLFSSHHMPTPADANNAASETTNRRIAQHPASLFSVASVISNPREAVARPKLNYSNGLPSDKASFANCHVSSLRRPASVNQTAQRLYTRDTPRRVPCDSLKIGPANRSLQRNTSNTRPADR